MLVRAYSKIRQEAQKCPEKIPKKFGGKRFLDGNGRENGSLPLSVALEREREREREREKTGVRRFFPEPRISLSNLCMW
jgi:hypothetical protein